MHHRPDQKKNCHSREGGNPQPIGGEQKVQLIMFTYLIHGKEFIGQHPELTAPMLRPK